MFSRRNDVDVPQTSSRIDVDPEYGPEALQGGRFDPARDLGESGRMPFTRGRRPGGYRNELWDMATYAGISSPEETNARFRFIVESADEHGPRNTLAMALDLPSQVGLDPDHELARGEIGRSGVSVASLRDVEAVYEAIPLRRIRMATVANGIGSVALAWFIGLATRRGTPLTDAVGNLQNDPFKEFTGRGTFIYPVEAHVRLALDAVEFAIRELPHWRPISVCGSQLRWGGATAVEELAFAVAHTEAYVDGLVARGIDVRDVLPLIEFHMATDNDVMEEVAKFRALRRLWARRAARRYGLRDDEVIVPSIQTYTAGYTLTAQQPLNNIVRIAIQVVSSVLGGVDYVATCSYDEAIATPTRSALQVALRTQQIVAHESGLANVADPLGGSYYVEWLTSELEGRATALLEEIESEGGAAGAIASGWTNRLIGDLAYKTQQEIESGERVVVGVNRFRDEHDGSEHMEVQRVSDDLEDRRRQEVAQLRHTRASRPVKRALADLDAAVRAGRNSIPATVEAVLADATIQEICDVLRDHYGEYNASELLG